MNKFHIFISAIMLVAISALLSCSDDGKTNNPVSDQDDKYLPSVITGSGTEATQGSQLPDAGGVVVLKPYDIILFTSHRSTLCLYENYVVASLHVYEGTSKKRGWQFLWYCSAL